MPFIFDSFTLKSITLRNRIAVAPMCQYMAEDGMPSAWHQVHYPSISRGGAGLMVVEATAVAPEGRISPYCLGLWNDQQLEVFKPIVAAIKAAGAVAGIQIAHAGRKANANRPWEGDDHIAQGDPRYWQILAPSAIAWGKNLSRVPKAMTLEEITRVQNDFVAAAKRAYEAGFEWLELHFAHGYLAQSFFSPLANQRSDQYGGTVENRGRFLLETLQKVKKVWPSHLPLTARFGVIEFDGHDEQNLLESIELINKFKADGLDLISVSINFNTPEAKIPWAPGFLGPIAQRIKKETKLPVASAWGFGTPEKASQAIESGQLDLVMVARSHLANPNWPYEVAKALKIENPSRVLPIPYGHWLERY